MATEASVRDRRKHERHACEISMACHPLTSRTQSWSGKIVDVSRGGVKLIVERRFERGAVLTIEVKGQSDEAPSSLLARVLHVGTHVSGRWVLGCQFTPELDESEVLALTSS